MMPASPAQPGRRSWKPLPLLAMLVGVGLTGLGLFAIVAYVQAVAVELSMLFWALFLPVIGVCVSALGVFFITLGRNARKPGAAARWVGPALVVVSLSAGVLTVNWIARGRQIDAESRALAIQEKLRSERERSSHKIETLMVDVAVDGLVVRTQTSSGAGGRYRLTLEVTDESASLFARAETLMLKGGSANIVRLIPYADLFRICRNYSGGGPPYACVAGGWADNLLTATTRLQLLEDPRGPSMGDAERGIAPIASSSSADFNLSTRTTQEGVTVPPPPRGQP